MSSYALNFRPTVRADHDSLDCVSRRLELALQALKDGEAKNDVKGALWHIVPMLTRHGGPIKWGQIELGSNEELSLICTQHGYARTQANLSDIANDIKETMWRWIKRKLWDILVASAWWLPLVAFLYFNRRKVKGLFIAEKTARQERDEEQAALHKAIEQIIADKEERKTKLSDPLIHRAHQRLKSEGLV